MLKDPEGFYHYTDGYVPDELLSDPVFLSPTYCGRDWKNEDGWLIVYWLDTRGTPSICYECQRIYEEKQNGT